MSILSRIKATGRSSSPGLSAAKEQKKIDKTVASGQRARARADQATAKAKRADVRTDIERKNGYRHGLTVGVYNLDTTSSLDKTKNRKNSRSRGSKK